MKSFVWRIDCFGDVTADAFPKQIRPAGTSIYSPNEPFITSNIMTYKGAPTSENVGKLLSLTIRQVPKGNLDVGQP